QWDMAIAKGGAGDDGKNGHTGGFVRGGLPKGGPVTRGIGYACRACAQGNHLFPWARRDREAIVLRLLRGAQEGPAGGAQSQDRQGGSDLAAPGHGVQALRHPQAAHQLGFPRRAEIARPLEPVGARRFWKRPPTRFGPSARSPRTWTCPSTCCVSGRAGSATSSR